MSRQPGPNVCTIPASVPFLPALIDALVGGRLIDGFKPNPLALADVTLYLPTRRACRMARAGFLGVVAADAAILPRIVALGDIDEDEFIFADTALDLPPALEGLERRMLLAQLVLKWAEQVGGAIAGGPPLIVNTPASALASQKNRRPAVVTTGRLHAGPRRDRVIST